MLRFRVFEFLSFEWDFCLDLVLKCLYILAPDDDMSWYRTHICEEHRGDWLAENSLPKWSKSWCLESWRERARENEDSTWMYSCLNNWTQERMLWIIYAHPMLERSFSVGEGGRKVCWSEAPWAWPEKPLLTCKMERALGQGMLATSRGRKSKKQILS